MGYHPCADWTETISTIPQVTTRLEQYNKARQKAQELMRRVQQSWVQHRDMCHGLQVYRTGSN
jgi:hypothetical protein